MKFILSDLMKYLKTNKSLEEILEDLIKIGLEVESYVDLKNILADFSVAKILETKKHPNADKLKICKVDTIFGIKDVVCGASNARENITVIYAKDGALIPKTKALLKKNEIRGVLSDGMLCSSAELNLGVDSDGILELDSSIEVGVNAALATNNDDVLIEVSITPNKGDFLSIENIARELSLLPRYEFIKHNKYNFLEHQNINEKLNIDGKDFSKGFYLLKVNDISNDFILPNYMEKKLKLIDCLTNIPIIDFINYIGMEYNQPMHVYDLDKLKSKDIKPFLLDKEMKMVGLDGKEYLLVKGDIIIIDGDEDVASIAGIMGADYCKVDKNTKNILIEIANFDKNLIGITKRRLNINSDAAYRFERGVDILQLEKIVNLVGELLKNENNVNVDKVFSYLQPIEKNIVNVNMSYLVKMMNLDITFENVKNILEKLEFKVFKINKDEFKVEVPSFRYDFFDKSDVLEEIVKFIGFDNIIEKDIKFEPINETSLLEYKVKTVNNSLYYSGFVEVMNMSFISEKEAKMYNIFNEKLKLINPISQDFAVMRSSLIPSIVKNVLYNNSYGKFNLKMYEIADCYYVDDKNTVKQEKIVAALISGYKYYKDVINKDVLFNVYDIKENLFNLINSLGMNPNSLQIDTNLLPCYLHPFKSGAIKMGKTVIAYFGEIHPYFVKQLGIKENIYCMELFIERFLNNSKVKYNNVKNISKDINLMSVYRDFAFVVDSDVMAIELVNAVKSVDKNIIKDVRLFDIYIINDQKKSLAINVEIKQIGKTLNENEIKEISDKIVMKVLKSVNGILRV